MASNEICRRCGKVPCGPVHEEQQRCGIERGSTRYYMKRVVWCEPCWQEQVSELEKARLDFLRKTEEQVKRILEGISNVGKL